MSEASSIPWRFDRNRAALIVVDMQRDFVEEGAIMEVAMARRAIPTMARVVEACRGAGIPVIYTRHVLHDEFDISPLEAAYQPRLKTSGMRAGTPGVEIVPELAPLPRDVIVTKHRYDAFHDTQLETVLRNIRGERQVDTLVIIGTVTSVCCESTARSAFMRDYKVAFISDANGGFDEASHNASCDILGRVFARVMRCDEFLGEM
ncbi:ureidoacrylate peracid hydrolase [Faunimonas pinastri]|uniref:Ureidoacrylate peracid hydrolase n=1 Tax=Faunimonas pinastri TaxID=1855383 RepID=A0A1H9K5Q4_9HYPH|nr:isochorismatase family cysteine hydrolase [Faunimonas pinastri]SEQ94392.1 ureidoacrylate peracid hydrolase [Faunimonas pinastri]